ncbi:hypothetical protein Vi05172_g8782 [Venturia inaequalis]|nr:hypothetical protein Vi05172_g8782 [Venturia inaequalis]
MKSSTLFLAIASCLLNTVSASTNSTLDAIVESADANIRAILEARTSDSSATCTSNNVAVRKEWSALSSTEKTEYITAVKCMMSTTAITPLSAAPGVRSRFDDFGALHVNQTASIHWTSNFFTWHRYYTWLYEKVLRDECGYTGYQPYWDWSSTDTLEAHPLFDGSDTSLSGNGEAVVHSSYVLIPTPTVLNSTTESGTGGGCLTSGPFANLTVNLGPHGSPVSDGLAYNPRCLTRDFRNDALVADLNYDAVTAVMMKEDLQSYSDLIGAGTGLHAAGHTAQGGFQDDLWASAQDPAFVFHHGQVDRVWSIWQAINQTVRTQEVSDTLTIKDSPASAKGT